MTILSSSKTPAVVVKELARILLDSLSSEAIDPENKEQLRQLLARLRQQHLKIFSEVSSNVINGRGEDGRAGIEQLILSLAVVSVLAAHVDYFLTPPSLDEPGFRAVGGERGQTCGPHNGVCRFGPKHAHSGSAGTFGGGRR